MYKKLKNMDMNQKRVSNFMWRKYFIIDNCIYYNGKDNIIIVGANNKGYISDDIRTQDGMLLYYFDFKKCKFKPYLFSLPTDYQSVEDIDISLTFSSKKEFEEKSEYSFNSNWNDIKLVIYRLKKEKSERIIKTVFSVILVISSIIQSIIIFN